MKPNGWIRSTKNCAAFATELSKLATVMEAQGHTQDDLSMMKVSGEINVKKLNCKKKNQANHVGGGGSITGVSTIERATRLIVLLLVMVNPINVHMQMVLLNTEFPTNLYSDDPSPKASTVRCVCQIAEDEG